MQANTVQAAAEQRGWLERRSNDDDLAKKVLEINMFCLHHQACLARKPSILSVNNLATALVRMCHTQNTTKFQNRLEMFFDHIVANLDLRVVGQLPDSVVRNIEVNRKLLDLCSSSLTADQVDAVLAFFNDKWSGDMPGFRIVHWCSPGCCENEIAAAEKCKTYLELLLGRLPNVPLLYRWKNFEPAVEYAFRGIVLHKLMVVAFSYIMGYSSPDPDHVSNDDLVLLDADDADLNPAERQRVRMCKTFKYFAAPDCLVT